MESDRLLSSTAALLAEQPECYHFFIGALPKTNNLVELVDVEQPVLQPINFFAEIEAEMPPKYSAYKNNL